MGAESTMNPYLLAAEAGMGVIQGISGLIGRGKANKDIKKLVNSRSAFETPDEIYDILNATQSRASTGLGAPTLDYLTGQTDRAFSGAIGASTLLGGDPNDLSAIFDQKMQGIMKIGAENHSANLANFSKYLGALNVVADNKAAEQVSADNLIKDKLQAASARGGQANLNLQGGLNLLTSAAGQYFGGKLFNEDGSQETKQEGGSLAVGGNRSFDRALNRKFGT